MSAGGCAHGVPLSRPCVECERENPPAPWQTIPRELADALRVALREDTLDVYTVREHEMMGWDGPRVGAISAAVQVFQRYAAPDDQVGPPPLSYEEAVDRLPVHGREAIIEAIQARGWEMNPKIEEQLRRRIHQYIYQGGVFADITDAIMEDFRLAHEADAVLGKRAVYVECRGETEPDAEWHASVAADKYPLPTRTRTVLREEPMPGGPPATYRWNPNQASGRLEVLGVDGVWKGRDVCSFEARLMRHAIDLADNPYRTEEVPVDPDNLWGGE